MTEVLTVDRDAPDPSLIARAADCLRSGGLVAFPTETVYGLGVNALDRQAVRRLFTAKGRPATDPLIVHVSSPAQLGVLVSSIPEVTKSLAAAFWPGPLTLIMPRSSAVPDEVTAGLDTVAVRVPSHPVAQALLESAAVPIAAPSANLFSRPSPTTAAHVLQDLGGRIDMVIDGGSTVLGIESTVLDLTGPVPTVLRPGGVTIEMLRTLLPSVVALRHAAPTTPGEAMPSPGLLSRHYSPRAPLTLYEGNPAAVLNRISADAQRHMAEGRTVGILTSRDDAAAYATLHPTAVLVVDFGSARDTSGVAARLYAAIREIDATGVDVILAHGVPETVGLGAAIQDRLRRAAAGATVSC